MPTGIDRVERAYLAWVRGQGGRFLATVDGRHHLLDADAAGRLVGWLDGGTDADGGGAGDGGAGDGGAGGAAAPLDLPARLRPLRDDRLRRAQAFVRRHGRVAARPADLPGAVYLNVGHENLTSGLPDGLRAAGLGSAVMVHDTIPLDHPEFSGRGSPGRFRRFLQAAAGADVVLTNSRDTAARLRRHLDHPRIVAAPLGIAPVAAPPRPAPPDPAVFLCVGTIEPRKNHAMLLDIWAGLGPRAPHLRIAGRRGWRNAAVLARLGTDPMMGRTVHEIGTPDDARLAAEIAGATAVLFPSLAEGYGLPVAEALALGTPVIASDLPALREVGRDVPDWLAPGDTSAWRAAILAHAHQPSPERAAQVARMAGWQPPTWERHFAIVDEAIGPR